MDSCPARLDVTALLVDTAGLVLLLSVALLVIAICTKGENKVPVVGYFPSHPGRDLPR